MMRVLTPTWGALITGLPASMFVIVFADSAINSIFSVEILEPIVNSIFKDVFTMERIGMLAFITWVCVFTAEQIDKLRARREGVTSE